MSVVSDLRQPEYVGANRCLPCTVVNVAIGALLGLGVSLLAPLAGFVVIGLSLVTIYLRGYLVPGTPELTKRYLPARVLRWFGKDPDIPGVPEPETADTFDPERLLADGGAIGPCPEIDDLCLKPSFRDAWQNRIERVGDQDPGPEELVTAIDGSGGVLDAKRVTDGSVLGIIDQAAVGRWLSNAAITADVAATDVLPEYVSVWESLSAGERIELLAACRLLLTTCPICDAPVELTQESIDSCCRDSYDVVRTTCVECGTHLSEFEWN
jgi:RNase P subunit RPR2